MKKILLLTLLLSLGIWTAYSYSYGSKDNDIHIEFEKAAFSKNADTMYVDFKFTKDGKKVRFGKFSKNNITINEIENGKSSKIIVDSIIDVRNRNIISRNVSIVLLVDKGSSITESILEEQKRAIYSFVEELPYVNIYVSAMDGSVTKTVLLDKDISIEDWIKSDFFEPSNSEKFLYKAIAAKLEEISGVSHECYPKVMHNRNLQDTTQKLLFILTNGKVKSNNKFIGGREFFAVKNRLVNEFPQMIQDGIMKNIPIYCIYFGDNKNLNFIQREMDVICSMGRKDDDKGRFYSNFVIDSLKEVLLGTIDEFKMDYRLMIVNPAGKVYKGQELNMQMMIDNQYNIAEGNTRYSYGTLMDVVVVPGKSSGKNLVLKTVLIGLACGIVLILLTYLFMQYMLPKMQYKHFLKKYVVKYRKAVGDRGPNDNVVSQQCYYCKEDFQADDDVVIKCKHTVHWNCWQENRNRCPEFGINNCKTGIYYYNQDDKSDVRNSPYFTYWLLFGLFGGMISWILFQILPYDNLCPALVEWLVRRFNPLWPQDLNTDQMIVLQNFQTKIQCMLLCGILFGFCVTFLFSYLIEFRKKNFKNMAIITLRSLANSVIGFLSFFIGAVAIVASGKDTNCFWVDFIPWLIFGCSITWLISFKTEIKFKNAILGGLISVLLSFIILYVMNFAHQIMGMFSFMIYAAGLGTAIAVVHYVSEKYFLHIEGPTKERDIAIYKWMSVTGGFNSVTIGSSKNCVIEMNWDDSPNIADKQLEVYLENDRPYCRALSDGTKLGSNNWPLKKNDVVLLVHGTYFTIGNTKFTYIEKDR